MRTLQEAVHRLWGTLSRRRRDDDLAEELRLHLELAAEDARRRGLGPDDAARAAAIATGGRVQAMEALRDQRGVPGFDDIARDVRYGFRMLRRAPVFAAVALLTLALGIGANGAIYQILQAVRLRPLPVEQPEQLALVELADLTRWHGRRATIYPSLTNSLWEEFRERQEIFSGVLVWSNADFRLGGSADARVARGLYVSSDFFNVLGVAPLIGRALTPADDRAGCDVPPAVLSHAFWQRYFGGDPSAIGRTLTLNWRSVEVVGVAPAKFSGLEVGRSFDLAAGICSYDVLGDEPDWLRNGTVWWLTVMGRISPGQSLDGVNRQLSVASRGLFEAALPADYPSGQVDDYLSFRLRAVPAAAGVSSIRTRYGDPLLILQLTAALVLFVACTNLANLVLARGSAREREFAVRLAIGGSWGRLRRQLMVENALLAIGGTIAGVLSAPVLSRLLIGLFGTNVFLDVPLDISLIGFGGAIGFLACLTFGLIPAWRVAHGNAADAARTARVASGDRKGSALRRALVVIQVACSLLLLVGGLLFSATLRNLLAVDVGFNPDGLAIARVDFSGTEISQERRPAFTADLLERIRGARGVLAAGEVRHVPLGGTGSNVAVRPDSARHRGWRL